MKKVIIASAITAATLASNAMAYSYDSLNNDVNLSASEAELINQAMQLNGSNDLQSIIMNLPINDVDGKIQAARLAASRQDHQGYIYTRQLLDSTSGMANSHGNQVNSIVAELMNAPAHASMTYEYMQLIQSVQVAIEKPDLNLMNAITAGLNRLAVDTKHLDENVPPSTLENVKVLLERSLESLDYLQDVEIDEQDKETFYHSLIRFVEAYANFPGWLNTSFNLELFLSRLDWVSLSNYHSGPEGMSLGEALLEGLVLERSNVSMNPWSGQSEGRLEKNKAYDEIAMYLSMVDRFSLEGNYLYEVLNHERSSELIGKVIAQQIELAIDPNYSSGGVADMGVLARFGEFIEPFTSQRLQHVYLDALATVPEAVILHGYYSMQTFEELEMHLDPLFFELASQVNQRPETAEKTAAVFNTMMNGNAANHIIPMSFLMALTHMREQALEVLEFYASSTVPANDGDQFTVENTIGRILNHVGPTNEEALSLLEKATSSDITGRHEGIISAILNHGYLNNQELQSLVDGLIKEGKNANAAYIIDHAATNNLSVKIDADAFGSGNSNRVANLYVDGNIARRLKNSAHTWTISMPMLGNDFTLYNVSMESYTRTGHCSNVTYTFDGLEGGASETHQVAHNGSSSGAGTLELPIGTFSLNSGSTLTVSGENCGSKQAWMDNLVLNKI